MHYQPEMLASFPGFTSGQDVGELYNMESDPNETHNLYAEAGYKNVVEQGRRLLLEWLIRTTRVVTCHPPQSRDGKTEYDLAGDGKEACLAGPAGRVRRGLVYYI